MAKLKKLPESRALCDELVTKFDVGKNKTKIFIRAADKCKIAISLKNNVNQEGICTQRSLYVKADTDLTEFWETVIELASDTNNPCKPPNTDTSISKFWKVTMPKSSDIKTTTPVPVLSKKQLIEALS